MQTMNPRVTRVVLLCLAAFFSLVLRGVASATEQTQGVLPSRPGVWMFDMGSEATPVWPGFTVVTPKTAYSAKSGYGWSSPTGLLGADVTRYHYKSSDIVEYVDGLSVDNVRGDVGKTSRFRLDVPNGQYVLWVLTGRIGGGELTRYLTHPHSLLVQGRGVRSIVTGTDLAFRTARYEWSKGDDTYDTFVGPYFEWLREDVEVAEGTIEIGFENAYFFPVCALVVAPRDQAERVEGVLRRIDVERKAVFDHHWREFRPDPDPPAPTSDIEKQRGYIVAATDCGADVVPWSQPGPKDSRDRVTTVAALGEQQQASFTVYARQDLREVQYRVTDLTAKSGAVLPSSAVECGLVQFAPWAFSHMTKKTVKQYQIFPLTILPARPTYIGKDTCKRFWLTLRAPEGAEPGVYRGKIEIKAADAPSTTLDLLVRVLPFRLMEPPFEHYCYFGTMYTRARYLEWQMSEETFWESMRAEVRFLKDNEMCRAAVVLGPKRVIMKDGKVVDVDLSPTYKLMEIIREENALPRDNLMVCADATEYIKRTFGGGWKDMGGAREIQFIETPEGRAAFVEAVRLVNARAQQAGWPALVFEAGGELSNFGHAMGTRYGLAAYGTIKEAGVLTGLRGNGQADMDVISAGLVDYPCPAIGLMASPGHIRTLKSHSQSLWMYGLSLKPSEQRAYRFSSGWFCFRHGITRMADEEGLYFNGQPGNCFSAETDWPMALPTSLTTFAPTVTLKRVVQGAYDYKYLYTLKQLIQQAEASKEPSARKAAAAANEWLTEMMDGFPLALNPCTIYETPDGHRWSNPSLDMHRWVMARHIMSLRKALGMKR